MNWCVYMIESSDGSLYTGITTDIARRFREHSRRNGNGAGPGARFFHGRRPVAVVYLERGHDRRSASVREAALKKLRRDMKNHLKQNFIELY